jgi:hypothetical protein
LVVRKGELRAEAVVLLVGLPVLEVRDRVPLLGRGHQTHVTVGGDALSVKNHLHRRVLLVDEDAMEGAVVENDAETLSIQVAAVGHLHRQIGSK